MTRLLWNHFAFTKVVKESRKVDNVRASLQKLVGAVVKCDMMSGTAKKYIRDADTTGFIKDYAGGRYAFMALLPNEGTSLSDHIGSLTAEKFTKLYENRLTNEEIAVYMPKLSPITAQLLTRRFPIWASRTHFWTKVQTFRICPPILSSISAR